MNGARDDGATITRTPFAAHGDSDGDADCDGYGRCDGVRDDDYDGNDEGDGDGDCDGDGYLAAECAGPSDAVDCDDMNPDMWPGNFEICDELDNDCDGLVDEGFSVGEVCQLGAEGCGLMGVWA